MNFFRPLDRELAKFLVERVAVFGQIDGRLQHLRKGELAVVGNRRRPGVYRRGNACRQVPVARNQVDAVVPAPIDGESLRRPAHAAYRHRLLFLGDVDQGRNVAADPIGLGFQDIEAKRHGCRRVDGIASLFHDAKAGCGSQIVTGRHNTTTTANYRA